MKIKIVPLSELETELRKKKGKRSKQKGNDYERIVAKKFKQAYGEELVRTPQSGGFAKKVERADDFRGDVVPADSSIDLLLHIEAKCQKTWSLPAWLKQSQEDCPDTKYPVVVFHQHGTSNDYIALKLEDFFELVPKESVIRERSE